MSIVGHTKVDSTQLNVAMANIERSLRVAENAIKAVDSALMGRLRPTWSGEAADTFFGLYTYDLQSFLDFAKALRVLNEQLGTASGNYERAESEAIDLVNSLRQPTAAGVRSQDPEARMGTGATTV